MSKNRKKAKAATQDPELAAQADRLQPGLDAFARGDDAGARALLGARADADDAPQSERSMAARFVAATKIEKETLLAGLACLGLYALVIAVTLFKQP